MVPVTQCAVQIVDELELLVDSLEAEITQSDFDGESQFANGLSACICTNGAVTLCQRLGRGVVLGFRDHDNPGTVCGEFAGGHDFALIDDRFIVDYWVKWVASLAERSVYDLSDPDDATEIRRLYGTRDNWVLVSRPV